eukprot:sb/3477092/
MRDPVLESRLAISSVSLNTAGAGVSESGVLGRAGARGSVGAVEGGGAEGGSAGAEGGSAGTEAGGSVVMGADSAEGGSAGAEGGGATTACGSTRAVEGGSVVSDMVYMKMG